MPESLLLLDQPVFETGVREFLGSLGFDVIPSHGSTRRALDQVARTRVDAAIVDVRIARIEDYALPDELAAKNIPFVFSSAGGEEELPRRFRDHSFIEKPFRSSGLVVAVVRLTGARDPRLRWPSKRPAVWSSLSYTAADLELAEKHVAEGAARIDYIETLFARFPSKEGERLLVELHRVLVTMTQHRDEILRELAAAHRRPSRQE